jgi:hypothetical protein
METDSPNPIVIAGHAEAPFVVAEILSPQRETDARLIAAAPRYHDLLCDAAMQLERLDGENLVAYARTFAALARQTTNP